MHANLNFEKNDWRVGPDETVQVLNAKEKKLQEFYLGKDENKTNWRSVIFALVVIGTVMIGVLIAVLAMGPLDDAAAWFHIPLTLEDALQQRDNVEALQVGNAVFMGDSVAYFDEDGGIDVFHPELDVTKNLVPSSVIRQLNSHKYNPSWNQKFVLLLHDETHQDGGWRKYYRYSIFVTSDNYHIPLRISTIVPAPPLLQQAQWAGRSSGLLLVWENNIYYKSNPLENEPTQLTFDGSDHILNGISDWLYHESLGLSDLLWPSENGKYLLFGRIDVSQVGEEEFVLFGSSPRSYQKATKLRYPKVGTTLPSISLVLMMLSNHEKIVEIHPSNITGSDSYLRAVSWSGDDSVMIAWTSRAHNVTTIIACSAPDFFCKEIYVERTRTKDEWLTTPHFVPSRKGKEEILFIDEVSDQRGMVSNQILHVRAPQHRATPLKHEGVSVVSLVGWDEDRQKVYFTGAPESRPFERHIYGITDTNNTDVSQLFCLTCINETTDDETLPFSCSFYNAFISLSHNYIIAECLGPTVPYTTVYQLHDGIVIKELNKNSELRRELMDGIKWRERRYEFDLEDGSVGHLQLLLPLKWKDSIHGRIQFPMIIEVPENPEDFEVASKWRRGFDMYQALGLQSAYAIVSGRERRHIRGAVLLAAEDIMTMVKALLSEVRFIDEERITIWGKGFGGYVATAVMALGQKEISCGAAVAPVTDWLSQDAASSEQYLGLVSEAYQSYVIGDLSRVAKQIPHNSFLLIHGSFSDPVHMQQSMSLAKALSQEGIQYYQQILPNTDYLLKLAEKQIYITINNFLHSCYRRATTQS